MTPRSWTPHLCEKTPGQLARAYGLGPSLRAIGLSRSTWYYRTRTKVPYAEKYAHLEAPLKANRAGSLNRRYGARFILHVAEESGRTDLVRFQVGGYVSF